MNLKDARCALKLRVGLRLASPLLLRSGEEGELADSALQRDGEGRLYVDGYVWAGLLRRALERFCPQRAAAIGKWQRDDPLGVSPLWCESSHMPLLATQINAGITIDRELGSARDQALYADELAATGHPLELRLILFAASREAARGWRDDLLKALKLIDIGCEGIGGGWSYGLGLLRVESCQDCLLDLRQADRRSVLWRWDDLDWTSASLPDQPPAAGMSWIDVEAGLAPGQLLAIRSSVPPLDLTPFGKLPDSFVFRRPRLQVDGSLVEEPVIPGKAIRQGLLSVALERRWRSRGEPICLSTAHQNPCDCRRCHWFGNLAAAGCLGVTEAPVENPDPQVLNRIQLCEHSRQNMNLFAGEFLVAGRFRFRILLDERRGGDAGELIAELTGPLQEMKEGQCPAGWYRVGGTRGCAGGIQGHEIQGTRRVA